MDSLSQTKSKKYRDVVQWKNICLAWARLCLQSQYPEMEEGLEVWWLRALATLLRTQVCNPAVTSPR